MHHFSDLLDLPIDSSCDLPCTPHLKPSSAPVEPLTTPRLRTSMSSHSRLMPDDLLDGSWPLHIGPVEDEEDTAQKANEGYKDSRGTSLMDLPEEIHQRILDMLMGELRPLGSRATDGNHALRNWNHAMRHPKGRRLAGLSLVTPSWRRLVQERIYRHIKIQGTPQGLTECYAWFAVHPHLSSFVRHIEFWVPVWERRGGQRDLRDPTSTTPMDLAVQFHDRLNPIFVQPTRDGAISAEPLSNSYKLSSQKSTLSEIFFCIDTLFGSARILTLEGGHCKKPPMIDHFRLPGVPGTPSWFTELPHIRTLVLRGAWNIMREEKHFQNMTKALPNVSEWHCSFTKPKSKAYFMMHSIIRHFPTNITHLNLCLEGFYSKKVINPGKMHALQREHHLCEVLGSILPQLVALTLTGRVCGQIFTQAIDAAHRTRKPRLESLDLTVKNCCRGIDVWNDGTGLHNMSFIAAFEHLVTNSTRALRCFPAMNFLRIRFVDLDAPSPLLNPYFQLQNNELTGIWNEVILKNVHLARPGMDSGGIADSMGQPRPFTAYPSGRLKSAKTSFYQTVPGDAVPW